jgi:hypothetical protein|tara:strand:- start:497 stop:1699 length:1203 start_codon:yes stop_codon:yes gene_type:complete
MTCSESKDPSLLESIILSLESDFYSIVSSPEKHRLQVLYTQIDRDENNNPSFTTHTFRLRPREYFYPASTTKFPVAVLALEKANQNSKINPYSRLEILTEKPELNGVVRDLNSESGYPSIAHYIHTLFIVSDNSANNRLYEFLGRDHINQRLWELGYPNARIRHRLSISLSEELNRYTNPFVFYGKDQKIYEQPSQVGKVDLDINYDDYLLGEFHYNNGKKNTGPLDFSTKNFMSISEQHKFMKQVMFPESITTKQQLDLSDEDYVLLYKEMSVLPRHSAYPKYPDYDSYYDGYCKFFMYGDTKDTIPDHIKIFNKVGLAYGFLLDNAYIIDTDNNVEFILTAVVYHNENETMNDDTYEYDNITIPFLAELGRNVYNFELARDKNYLPDFSRFINNLKSL